ncbi:MAG: NAD(P)-dependent oxidoreductase [Gammaproteobacteria bacterium]
MSDLDGTVGFIGLGVMGGPMAGHLVAKGFNTVVYNRSPEKMAMWSDKHQAQVATSPAEVAKTAAFVISCVGNDDDLREVAMGPDGAIAAMTTGSVYIDHSTTSADVAIEVAEYANERAVSFVDAPVSGGQAGAEAGALTVMCGGTEHAFERAKPVISAYAKACTLMGPSGAGQLTKMVNQICIAGLLQGLAEGLNFGLRAGLNMDSVIDVISKGAAQSWQLENRGKTMCRDEFDFGFAVDLMRKDLGIVLAEAKRKNASIPVAELVDSYYAQLQRQGHNRADTSSLIKLLRAID